jgi:hypothetical protein
MSDVARSLSYRVTVRSESRFVSPPPVRIKSLALSQSDLTASSDMAMRANGGRHECARHIRRHLGWAPEPSVNHRLGCASATLVGIDRLVVREISARAPLRARRSWTLFSLVQRSVRLRASYRGRMRPNLLALGDRLENQSHAKEVSEPNRCSR